MERQSYPQGPASTEISFYYGLSPNMAFEQARDLRQQIKRPVYFPVAVRTAMARIESEYGQLTEEQRRSIRAGTVCGSAACERVVSIPDPRNPDHESTSESVSIAGS